MVFHPTWMVAAEVPSAAWLRSRRDGALYLLRRPGRPTPLKVAQQIQKRMRKQITGAEDLRIRDHVRERMEQPPVVRLRDKVSFMFGVLGCAVLEFVILRQPHDFATCYLLFIIPLLFMRLWMYTKLKWHYFLIDFCYVANAACLLQVRAAPRTHPSRPGSCRSACRFPEDAARILSLMAASDLKLIRTCRCFVYRNVCR